MNGRKVRRESSHARARTHHTHTYNMYIDAHTHHVSKILGEISGRGRIPHNKQEKIFHINTRQQTVFEAWPNNVLIPVISICFCWHNLKPWCIQHQLRKKETLHNAFLCIQTIYNHSDTFSKRARDHDNACPCAH